MKTFIILAILFLYVIPGNASILEHNFEYQLELDQDVYHVGDPVQLTFTITSAQEDMLRLFGRKWYSLDLRISSNENMPLPAPVLIRPEIKAAQRKIEEIPITKDRPYQLSIHGKIKRSQNEENLVLDFGAFGIFELGSQETFHIQGLWREAEDLGSDQAITPIAILRIDSLNQ